MWSLLLARRVDYGRLSPPRSTVARLGEGKRLGGNASSSMSVVEFAAFGIAGLKSKDTVRRYVD